MANEKATNEEVTYKNSACKEQRWSYLVMRARHVGMTHARMKSRGWGCIILHAGGPA
jgi:hypothetical protein